MNISVPGGYIIWNDVRTIKYFELIISHRMVETGQLMVGVAKRMAPVDTGRLRAGIVFHYNHSKFNLTLVADAPYSEFQEFGTRFFRAHPFIRPAIEAASKFWKGNVRLGMGFYHTPRLQSPVAVARNKRQMGIMKSNLKRSERFNRGAAGKAAQYRRSYRGGPGS